MIPFNSKSWSRAFVDSNNQIHARAKCPSEGCPGGQTAEQYAAAVLKKYGYTEGQNYTGLTIYGTSADLLSTMISDVSELCGGDASCADYLIRWWICHYGKPDETITCPAF